MSNAALEIQIVQVKHSEKRDHSLNYLIDFSFRINGKFFTHTDYLDSCNRKTVKKLTEKSQLSVADKRLNLILELEVKLRITDTQAQQLFDDVLNHTDDFIEKSEGKERRFPTQNTLIAVALSHGFWLVEQSSKKIHLMKAEWKYDREWHIEASSIHFLIDELTDYASGDGVTDCYSYRELVQRNSDQTGFTLAVNPFGNGWLIENWYPRDQFPTDHVYTLKELSERINFLIAEKATLS